MVRSVHKMHLEQPNLNVMLRAGVKLKVCGCRWYVNRVMEGAITIDVDEQQYIDAYPYTYRRIEAAEPLSIDEVGSQ